METQKTVLTISESSWPPKAASRRGLPWRPERQRGKPPTPRSAPFRHSSFGLRHFPVFHPSNLPICPLSRASEASHSLPRATVIHRNANSTNP